MIDLCWLFDDTHAVHDPSNGSSSPSLHGSPLATLQAISFKIHSSRRLVAPSSIIFRNAGGPALADFGMVYSGTLKYSSVSSISTS